jgi:hypothetical protein
LAGFGMSLSAYVSLLPTHGSGCEWCQGEWDCFGGKLTPVEGVNAAVGSPRSTAVRAMQLSGYPTEFGLTG